MKPVIRLLAVAATAGAMALGAGVASAQTIRLMTGPQGGVWVPLGAAMKNLWETGMPGVTVQTLPGAGIAFDVWLDYARLLDEAGYYKDMIETLSEGIKYFPEAAELYYGLGVILLETGKRLEGMEAFARALELNFNKYTDIFEYAPALKDDAQVLELINSFKN